MLDSLPGSGRSSCATVGRRGDVRSGGLAMGNFGQARAAFARGSGIERDPVPMYVIPRHSGAMDGVTVTLRRVSGGAATRTRSTSVETADVWKYYAVQLPVRSAGTYRLNVVSGPDHGCFVVTFGRSKRDG